MAPQDDDLETCSRCLNEFRWLDLNHVTQTGENVCDDCATIHDDLEPVE